MWTELLLFIALQPGLLVAFPRVAKGRTSLQTILVHAALFYVLVRFKANIPGLNMLEGFQAAGTPLKIKAADVAAEIQPIRDANKTARAALRTTQKAELQALQKKHQDERAALRTTQNAALKQAIVREYKKKNPSAQIPTDASGNAVLVE